MLTKEKVLEAIQWAKDNGWKVQPGIFYREDPTTNTKFCCPIGAVGLKYNADHPDDKRVSITEAAKVELEISNEEMWEFIHGYDNAVDGSPCGKIGVEIKEQWRREL
jgi:hypothetical protein